ncbi:MAG: hypothetical protein ACR2IP_14125 [Solirubrobacteraceae bacterium]
MPERDLAREEADRAAAEAGALGGRVSSEPPPVDAEGIDEAQRPLDEAGQGEAEGFEEAERELVEHASHGDQHAARRVIEEAPLQSDDSRASDGGEGDSVRSSELDDER